MADELANILESAEPVQLAADVGFTEGPLYHPDGSFTFVDLRDNRILRWDPQGGVQVARENTGGANGCTLDRRGRMIVCEGTNRRVTRFEPDGAVTVLADNWQGKKLNRPNDVICRSDGTIYFTDPGTFVPKEERELDVAGVYRISPGGEYSLAIDDIPYPNGLALSPDERILYVAVSRLDERCVAEGERGEVCRHRAIRAYDVAPDGSVSNSRLFADMSSAEPGVPDGMKVDTEGRVYCTGSGGIWVLTPGGQRLGIIRCPEVPHNIAFGGDGNRTLFATAGASVYSYRTKVHGIGAF